MTTIATHHGTTAHRAHNLRINSVVASQEHIDKDRTNDNIVLIDETPQDAYKRIFGDSLKRYNDKQTRTDRVIDNYYTKVKNNPQRVPVYESIIGVYPDENVTLSQTENVQILSEFLQAFRASNPNFEIIGAYIHLDEKSPHMHLDYIPVGHDYKRGMDTQVSMDKALKEQGYYTKGSKDTALKHWTKDVNVLLEKICNKHGLEVEHPEAGNGTKHLETEAYKLSQDISRAYETKYDLEKQNDVLYETINDNSREKDELEVLVNNLSSRRYSLETTCEKLTRQRDSVNTALKTAQNALDELKQQTTRALEIKPENVKGNKRQIIEDLQSIIRRQKAQLEAFNYKSDTTISELLELPDKIKTLEQKNEELSSKLSDSKWNVRELSSQNYSLKEERNALIEQLDIFKNPVLKLLEATCEKQPELAKDHQTLLRTTAAMAAAYVGDRNQHVWNKDFINDIATQYEEQHRDVVRSRRVRSYDDYER